MISAFLVSLSEDIRHLLEEFRARMHMDMEHTLDLPPLDPLDFGDVELEFGAFEDIMGE